MCVYSLWCSLVETYVDCPSSIGPRKSSEKRGTGQRQIYRAQGQGWVMLCWVYLLWSHCNMLVSGFPGSGLSGFSWYKKLHVGIKETCIKPCPLDQVEEKKPKKSKEDESLLTRRTKEDFVMSAFQVAIHKVQQRALEKASCTVPTPDQQLEILRQKQGRKQRAKLVWKQSTFQTCFVFDMDLDEDIS